MSANAYAFMEPWPSSESYLREPSSDLVEALELGSHWASYSFYLVNLRNLIGRGGSLS